MALGEDQLVLERMLQANELGHSDFVALRLEIEPPNDIGEVGAELATLHRMPP